MKPPDYSLLNNKKYFDSFEDLKLLGELHFKTKDSALIFSGYSKAMNFILDVVVDPTLKYRDTDMNPESVKKVFENLKLFLDGSFDTRYGQYFSTLLKDQMKLFMHELYDELTLRHLPDALFPSVEYLIPINHCFAHFDIPPITIR